MIVLSTGSLYVYGMARVFELAAETGYDGVEVLIDARWDSRDPDYLRRLSADYQLPVMALHSPFVPDVHGWPQDQLGRLERTVGLAKELSVPLVVSHLPFRLLGIRGHLNFFDYHQFLLPLPWLKRGPYYHFLHKGRVEEKEASSGIIIALENMPAHRFLRFTFNAYWFNRLNDIVTLPHLTLDTTHLATWGLDPVDVYERLKRHVVHVHISNYDGTEHRLPFRGHLHLDQFLGKLAAYGYQGVVSVETSPEALDADNERKCREFLRKTLNFCRNHFRRI